MKKILCFGLLLTVFLCTCKKPVRYSDIPEIKLISFEKLPQDAGYLVFYFQDGEGDIGLDDWAISPPFEYNFFCDYFEKQNNVFVKIDSIKNFKGEMIPFNLNGRIPRLSSLPEESINGEIRLTMPNYRDPYSEYDTTQLKFYIVDRKLNKSNTEKVNIIR